MTTIKKLFNIDYGQNEYHSKEYLDSGDGFLISSQGVDNGCYGFFNIPSKYTPPLITIPSTGSIGEAFVQTNFCSVDDNCLVLEPKYKLSLDYLFYVATRIRIQRWRYMYGRQITPYRIGKMKIENPHEYKNTISYEALAKKLIPQKTKRIAFDVKIQNSRIFRIDEIFNIRSGDFHSVEDLNPGQIPLVSCSDMNNGITGFYDISEEKTYVNMITVAYDGQPLSAKFHNYRFAAYDNVGVCVPKIDLKATTLFLITLMLNRERWRYSYGRKCYKAKLQNLQIKLPATFDDKIDQDLIEEIVNTQDVFGYIAKMLKI